jgi:hypothetical protein
MRFPNRIILTIIVSVMMLSLLTGNVQATNPSGAPDSMGVSIQSASYLALDADMVEDDILTVFTISIPVGVLNTGWTLIYMVLELPSGLAYGCNLLVIGIFSQLSLTLGWHNTATQAGWYSFDVSAYMVGNNALRPGFDSIIFDPPTEGKPGSPPSIEVIVISAI